MSEADHSLHLGLAENGKLHALKGEHHEALRHYREAMRLAVERGAPEVFFRHYTQCVLESLEHLGNLDEVLAFCERAEAHYRDNPPPHELARLDRASHHERRGVALLKRGRTLEARAAFEAATAEVGGGRPALAHTLLGWLRRGLQVDARRLRAEQDRHRYFSVRKDAVDASLAIPLPAALGPAGRPA